MVLLLLLYYYYHHYHFINIIVSFELYDARFFFSFVFINI